MKPQKTWEVVAENLLKNGASGRYYARFEIAGKPKWIALKTDKATIARVRLADAKATIERQRLACAEVSDGTATLGSLARILRQTIGNNAGITEKTRRRYNELIDVVAKTWPAFDSFAPENVTRQEAIRWRDEIKKTGTGFICPGAKKRSAKNDGSASGTINKAIDMLRRMLDIAVERGQIRGNPIKGRGIKLPSDARKPVIPERAALNSVFAEIEARGTIGGRGIEVADFCRFLAFTGCRLSEAGAATWADTDLTRGLLRVRGTKTDAAARTIPLIPDALALLEKIRGRRDATAAAIGEAVKPTAPILLVRDASISLDHACKAKGVTRLTHHDLRDVFATTAIEAGVDIPTVAAWLGHADGGALLMRTYNHLRQKHSLAQARLVSFA